MAAAEMALSYEPVEKKPLKSRPLYRGDLMNNNC